MHGLLIAADDPTAAEVRDLIDAHLAFAHEHTPPGHVHALEAAALLTDDIFFFTARRFGTVVGMGALRRLDEEHGEIKSIHTSADDRMEGIGQAMLAHLVGVAGQLGMSRVSLETGTMPAFAPARELFSTCGFEICEPFADYTTNPNSVCMTRYLE